MAPQALVLSLVAVTTVGLLVGLVGLAIGAGTFVGWLQRSAAAEWGPVAAAYMLGGFLLTAALALHERGASSDQPPPTYTGTVRAKVVQGMARLGLVFFALWLAALVALFALGGPGNKGLREANGHYYILHAAAVPTEISRAEYQRQLAYPIWMIAAWDLWTSNYSFVYFLRHVGGRHAGGDDRGRQQLEDVPGALRSHRR